MAGFPNLGVGTTRGREAFKQGVSEANVRIKITFFNRYDRGRKNHHKIPLIYEPNLKIIIMISVSSKKLLSE